MSSSSFRFIPHQPLLFYTLRSIRNMLFLSFCVTYLSLHKFFPSHIFCMQLRLFFSTKYDILDIVGHYYFCHQNIKFTFTTIVTFKQHSKPFLAGLHIFLTGNCTVCEEMLVNFVFLRHVQHLLTFLDLEYPSSISEKASVLFFDA